MTLVPAERKDSARRIAVEYFGIGRRFSLRIDHASLWHIDAFVECYADLSFGNRTCGDIENNWCRARDRNAHRDGIGRQASTHATERCDQNSRADESFRSGRILIT